MQNAHVNLFSTGLHDRARPKVMIVIPLRKAQDCRLASNQHLEAVIISSRVTRAYATQKASYTNLKNR